MLGLYYKLGGWSVLIESRIMSKAKLGSMPCEFVNLQFKVRHDLPLIDSCPTGQHTAYYGITSTLVL